MSFLGIDTEQATFHQDLQPPPLPPIPASRSRQRQREFSDCQYATRFRRRRYVVSVVRALVLLLSDIAAIMFVAGWQSGLTGALALRALPGVPGSDTTAGRAADAEAAGFVLALVLALVVLIGRGHYRTRITFWTAAFDVTSACALAALVSGFFGAAMRAVEPTTMLLLSWAATAIAIVSLRVVVRRALAWAGLWQIRTLVLGENSATTRACSTLTADRSMGYEIAATMSCTAAPVTAPVSAWYSLMQRHRADLIAIAGTTATEDRALLSSLSFTDIPHVFIVPIDVPSVIGCRLQHVYRHEAVLMTMQPCRAEAYKRAVKRTADVLISAPLLLLLLPTFLLVSAAIRRDGGPALFRQRRIGQNGQEFDCLKLRSMRIDAAAVLADLLAKDGAARQEWAQTRKLQDDPRVTRIGKVLRSTSIDELPQLWNVLKGDMSLVGPRPIVADEIGHYGQLAPFYTRMKPGLTGLWQASGRSSVGYEQRVRLDVWYVRNWTLWQDFAILLMTVPAVLLRRGAV